MNAITEMEEVLAGLPLRMRRRHIYRLGASVEEVEKLIETGVLREIPKSRPNQRAYFLKTHVVAVLFGVTGITEHGKQDGQNHGN